MALCRGWVLADRQVQARACQGQPLEASVYSLVLYLGRGTIFTNCFSSLLCYLCFASLVRLRYSGCSDAVTLSVAFVWALI